MDFSKFSHQDFDPKEWINDAFRLPEAQKNREQHASTLVMKLQLFIQEVNRSLEETSNQLVQTMPRILREVESMQQETVLLQNRMKAVQQDVQKVEQETATAMEDLLQIDTVKGRMLAVEKALREIDNWSLLTGDIEEVFASGDADLMATRLVALQLSLSVIGHKIPDYRERSDYLERLKDQFISVVSPSVVSAFQSRTQDTIRYYARVFEDLERAKELEQYYQKCLKAEINKCWNELLAARERDGSLADLWSRFFDLLLSTWMAQTKWCSGTLSEAGRVVCWALTQSLGQLDPSPVYVLQHGIDFATDKLQTLTNLKMGCDSFLGSLAGSLSAAGVDAEHSSQLSTAIFRPLVPFIANYQQYQQSAFLEKLNLWSFDGVDFGEIVTHFANSVAPIFHDAQQAIEECGELTGDLGFPFLLKALQVYFSNYLTLAKKILDNISRPKDADIAFPDENWDRVVTSLNLLKVTGNLCLELEKVEENLLVAYSKVRKLTDRAGITVKGLADEKEEEQAEEAPLVQSSPFEEQLLVDPNLRRALETLIFKLGDSDAPRFLGDLEKQIRRMSQKVMRLTMEQVFGPVDALFDSLPKLDVWAAATVGESLAETLPNFSLAPQEYITKIGQYLMTLAHHLEPFLSSADTGFCAALNRISLPHTSKSHVGVETCEQGVQLLLESAGEGIEARFVDAASRIRQLSPSGAQQLATDMDFASNVVEDLGLVPAEALMAFKELLRMEPKALKAGASSRFPPHLVSAVRQMRKIQ